MARPLLQTSLPDQRGVINFAQHPTHLGNHCLTVKYDGNTAIQSCQLALQYSVHHYKTTTLITQSSRQSACDALVTFNVTVGFLVISRQQDQFRLDGSVSLIKISLSKYLDH